MMIRLSKMALVATTALFFTLVAFGNVTDYGSNFQFVKHVLSMDTTFESSALMWRAITHPLAHHVAYWIIIAWQIMTALLLWAGLARLWRAREHSAVSFQANKDLAVLGLTAGFLLYGLGFLVIAGEWFAMWQSDTWNGQQAAHIFLMMIVAVMIYLVQQDPEPGG